MKLLLVGGGADFSLADVERGYRDALAGLGHRVIYYNLTGRLSAANDYLRALYRRRKAGRPPMRHLVAEASANLCGMALYHDVEWVVVISAMFLDPDQLVMLRRAGRRVALIGTESPYDDDRFARLLPHADVAFTNERTSVAPLRATNLNVHYLPAAYDPARHSPEPRSGDAAVPAHDVVLVASLFPERIRLLERVDWGGIDFGLYGATASLPSRHRLRRHIRGGIVDNATTAALYRRAKIGLNLYRTSARGESLNPRAYELAACGAFHLSDHRAEIPETFGPLVPTFASAGELARLVRQYLAQEDWRRDIARRLPATVAAHTYAARAEQLVSALRAGRPTMHAAVAAGG